jgi:hypothetical protein
MNGRTSSNMLDEKPEIANMIVDEERCQQQLQFVNSIIKNENIE